MQVHSDSEDFDDAVSAARSVSIARCSHRPVIAGVSIAGLCMAAMLCIGILVRGDLETAATRWGVSYDVMASGGALFGKPGEQCGGLGFQGNTCCQAGCACIYKDQSNSECQPPIGLTSCNAEAAKLQLELSNENLGRVKKNVAATAKMGAFFQATAMNSHDGFMKADKAQKDAFQYGLAKRVVWQADKDKKAAAVLAADKAQKKVDGLVGTNQTLVAELTALQKASFDNGLQPPKCSPIYQTCTPSEGCCSGCICLPNGGNSFLCKAPGQGQECNVAAAQAKVQVQVVQVQSVGERLKAAQAEAQQARTAAQEATAASAAAFKEAASAGALREDAVEAAAGAQMDSEMEQRQADKARDLAKHAYEAEEIAQAVAAAWEKATAGNAC